MSFLGVDVSDTQRADVLLDFHFYNYAFCKDQGFTAAKTSCFFSILKRVVQQDTNINTEAIAVSFERFKNLLLKHSVQRPPHSVAIFNTDDVGKITDYIANSYYRHFHLYKFIFTKRSVVQLQQHQSCAISQVRLARPLAEGMEHLPPPVIPEHSQSKVEIDISKVESPIGF